MTRGRRLRKRRGGMQSTGRPQVGHNPNLPARTPQWGYSQQDHQMSAEMHHRVFMEGYNTAIGDYERNKSRIYEEARQRAFREAARGPYLAVARQKGYQEGYGDGYKEGERAGMVKASDVDEFYTRADVSNARREGFNEGVFTGRAQARASQKARGGESEEFDREKVIEEMLDQCKIISESNPGMAPGVNAVRHRIKKLKKK